MHAALQIAGVNGVNGPALQPLAQRQQGLLLSGFVKRNIGMALPPPGADSTQFGRGALISKMVSWVTNSDAPACLALAMTRCTSADGRIREIRRETAVAPAPPPPASPAAAEQRILRQNMVDLCAEGGEGELKAAKRIQIVQQIAGHSAVKMFGQQPQQVR